MAETGETKKKVIPVIIEGFEINAQNVTFQKLQEFSLTLFEKLLSQRKERNFLLLDRDKMRTILENTRHEIMLVSDTIKNKEEELEQAENKYRQDRKEIEEEVKYILYDHNINLEELKVWEKNLLTKKGEEHLIEELELLKEKRTLKELLVEQEMKNDEEMKNIRKYHVDEISALIEKHNEIHIANEIEFKKSLNESINKLNLKHEMEMSEVEERMNTHLVELKIIHKERLEEMKSFFNSITSESLTVISNLKQSLDGMKKSKDTMTVTVKQLKGENKKLKDPLAKSKLEVRNLTRKLINYEKDLLSLKTNKRMLKQARADTRKIKKQNSLALKKIETENFENKNSVASSCLFPILDFKVQEVHRRHHLSVLIERFTDDLKKKQNLLKQLTSDPEIEKALSELNFEYWDPRRLNYELAVVCKAHDELLETLQEKLDEFCITEENLEFNPTNLENIGKAPGALVSKQ